MCKNAKWSIGSETLSTLSLSSEAPDFGEAKASNGALMESMNVWMIVCVNEQYLRLLIIHLSVELKGGATVLQPYGQLYNGA